MISVLLIKSNFKQACGDLPAQAFPCALPLSVPEESLDVVMDTLSTLSDKIVTVKLYSKDSERYFFSANFLSLKFR